MSEKIQIAHGNSKMGRNIPSVSLVPIKDCANCGDCAEICYAQKYFRRYKDTRAAYERNSRIFRASPYDGTAQIAVWLDKRRKLPEYFRIHVAGDFLNQAHITAYIKLAKLYPMIKFLAFTKRHDLNFRNIPVNLKVIHSFGMGAKISLRYSFNAYIVKDTTNVNEFICGGDCSTCKECFEGNVRKIIFKLH